MYKSVLYTLHTEQSAFVAFLLMMIMMISIKDGFVTENNRWSLLVSVREQWTTEQKESVHRFIHQKTSQMWLQDYAFQTCTLVYSWRL